MRWGGGLGARIDLRLAVFVAGAAAAVTSLLLCGLLAFAIQESLEEQDRVLADSIAAIAAAESAGTRAPTHHGSAYRVTDAAGSLLSSGGDWPVSTGRPVRPSLRTALTCSGRDYLVRETRLRERTITVATALHRFARERGELVRGAAGVVLLGMAWSLGFGVLATRRALRPVRQMTAAVQAIDPRHLDTRLATRGTPDDVDALAAAINKVLERLEWAFGRLSRFSADVAHELRTPINRILNGAEIALRSRAGEGAKDQALSTVHETAEHMRDTVEQLLLLARGEEGRLSLIRERVDLHALLEGLVALYAPLAERGGRTLTLAGTRVEAGVDRALVERAVANLLENAIAHTPEGSVIRLGTSVGERGPVVVVEDSGPGIAPADAERVFERFVRLAPSPGREGGGLGLSIARMIARVHGGELRVDRSPLGGAAFVLALGGDA